MVQLGVDPDDIVSGDAKTNFFPRWPARAGARRYEWIVQGQAGIQPITVKAVAQKGGSATERTVTAEVNA